MLKAFQLVELLGNPLVGWMGSHLVVQSVDQLVVSLVVSMIANSVVQKVDQSENQRVHLLVKTMAGRMA